MLPLLTALTGLAFLASAGLGFGGFLAGECFLDEDGWLLVDERFLVEVVSLMATFGDLLDSVTPLLTFRLATLGASEFLANLGVLPLVPGF
jgi:hypothetical protein